jgi:nicotinamidase-related amidase
MSPKLHISRRTTALLLIEYQNEFTDPRGGLYASVRVVLEATRMLQKSLELIAGARERGVLIIHCPNVVDPKVASADARAGMMTGLYRGLFLRGSWGAEMSVPVHDQA